jgi:dynein heavy chain
MNANGWKDACKLGQMGGCWATIIEDIKDHERQWKNWYDMEAPEEAKELPCGYTDKTQNDKFKALLIVRVFRPDRVINAIKRFIITRMNDFYVKSPPLVYQKIFK